ncbi:MAG: Uma2 family endonuclease [Flammeovirgaceae bacterium]
MKLSDLDITKTYSYADYLTWQFQERVELIKGKLFKMSPAPSRQHQKISRNLATAIGVYFEDKPCEYYAAPFDVRLATKDERDNEILTVVQPDLCVICDSNKLDDKGCLGAPDWIIEILSPGNSKKELKNKYKIYEESGVKEYWLVHPSESTVFIYVLKNGEFVGLQPVTEDEIVSPTLFHSLTIDLHKIFNN